MKPRIRFQTDGQVRLYLGDGIVNKNIDYYSVHKEWALSNNWIANEFKDIYYRINRIDTIDPMSWNSIKHRLPDNKWGRIMPVAEQALDLTSADS